MFTKGFPQDRLITYSGMLWLLAAQIVVMIPLLFYLPVWLLPILFFSAGWRIRVMLGKAEQPGIVIKVILGVLGLGALKLSGIPIVSLEMTASLLMLGFAYKSLEVIQRRDGMVVILTGFILIGVLFLYSQSILITIYSVISVVVLTGAMVAIQQSGNQTSTQKRRSSSAKGIFSNLRLVSSMLMLCLPLMILFFVFAPRFQPFWTVPMAGGQAKTGISDSMSPGDIAKLSQSDELAFTVSFQGKRPKQSDLYWRGLVMQYFDGTTWTQNDPEQPPRMLGSQKTLKLKESELPLKKRGEEIKYRAIYQKTGQPWMFVLNPVVSIKGPAIFGSDFRVLAKENIIEPVLVKLTSYPDSLKELTLDDATRATNLQLPDSNNSGNQKSRLLAEQLYASSTNNAEYVQRVLQRFREQEYFYTLRPPLLGDVDTIDGFLIDSKKGFCAHYAGSFVFMMRAVGIPARVVTGYQGGEWNEKGQFLAVHQFDAHAWTEVWLEGEGWQRFDPTAMVAPQRIEQNLEAAMQQEGSFLEGKILSLNKMKWLSGLRQQLDSLQYGWQRFVLNYDNDTQQNFLKNLFGEMTVRKTMFIVGGIFGGIVLIWIGLLGMFKKRNTEAPEHQLYRRFCALLAKKGVIREIAQTPEAFAQMAKAKLPDSANFIQEFTQNYATLCYSPSAATEPKPYLDKMRSVLKQIK